MEGRWDGEEGSLDQHTYLAEPCHPPTCLPARNTHTHTHAEVSFLRRHKVTECRYKRAQPSNKWDLACSINSAAKSLLLSVAKPYLCGCAT